MKLVDNLTEEEYMNFFYKSKYNHFLQSYYWGQTCKVRNQEPYYLGLKDDNGEIQAACMVLKKSVPFNMSYYYAPRGFVMDWDNYELIEAFTKEIKKYMKAHNSIYFRLDPAIKYRDIDELGNGIENENVKKELYDKMLSLGYIHRGFPRVFIDANQPRYTFRIDTSKPIEEIEKNINKTFMKTVKRSYNYDLEVSDKFDSNTFYNLMKEIAKKDNFNGNSERFYEEYYKSFGENSHYVNIKIYPDKILEKSRKELDSLKKQLENNEIPEKKMADTNNLISRYEKDIETFQEYEGKYPDGLVSLILICPKTNKSMWTLYIGNNSLATYTFAVNRAYYEAIKYASEHHFEFLDLYGTQGDPTTKIKNYANIHEYKRKMGGEYTEFIGEFDLINKPILYKLLPHMLKIYRKLRKR